MRFIIIVSTIILISSSAFAQKGIIANYKTDQLFLSFSHVGTKELLQEPIVQGTNVTIKYNISFQSFEISYIDAMEGVSKKMKLNFVRYENSNSNRALIMADETGSPFTVYNDLEKDGSLSIISHQIIENEYMAMSFLMDAKEVF